MSIHNSLFCCLAAACIGLCGPVAVVFAQAGPSGSDEAPPEDLLEVGVSEHLGEKIPLDLVFEDSKKNKIKLEELFDGEHPVLLTLNYSNCPQLCNLQLTGLFEGLKEMEWSAGDKFTVVSVSIDPAEPAARAAQTRSNYLKQYARPDAASGVRFLVGSQKNIRALADSVGFRYKYLPDKDEYAHVAAAIIITPDGTISRYLYDVKFGPQTLKFALLEATDGKIGSTMDQVLLYCYQYDETKGKYAPVATRVMKAGGLLAVLILGAALAVYWIRESRRSAKRGAAKPDGKPTQAGA